MIRSRPGHGTVLAGIVFVCVLLAGCATQRTVNGFYLNEVKGFRVQVPWTGWEVAESPGVDLTLRDTRSQAHMAVSASCPAGETGPLPSLVRHLFFGLRQVKRLREGCILLDGVRGLETVVTGRWEGTPVQVRSVVVRRQGCLYDLLLVAPPEIFGARSADFDRFLEGWQFLSERP